MDFFVGRRSTVVDISVDGSKSIFVLEVGGLLQLLANFLPQNERCRPSVAESQHQEYRAQQRHLQHKYACITTGT